MPTFTTLFTATARHLSGDLLPLVGADRCHHGKEDTVLSFIPGALDRFFCKGVLWLASLCVEQYVIHDRLLFHRGFEFS